MSPPEQYTAADLGAIRNSLGILSDDRLKIRPQALRDVTQLRPSKIAEILDVQRPNVYRQEIPIPRAIREKILKLVLVTDLAYQLMGNNLEETIKWVMAPNSAFLGNSPFEVVMRGDGNELIDWLGARAGLRASAAF